LAKEDFYKQLRCENIKRKGTLIGKKPLMKLDAPCSGSAWAHGHQYAHGPKRNQDTAMDTARRRYLRLCLRQGKRGSLFFWLVPFIQHLE
jgi:hypothetical protein